MLKMLQYYKKQKKKTLQGGQISIVKPEPNWKKSSTNNDICFLKETMVCSSKKDENPSVSPFLMAMQ